MTSKNDPYRHWDKPDGTNPHRPTEDFEDLQNELLELIDTRSGDTIKLFASNETTAVSFQCSIIDMLSTLVKFGFLHDFPDVCKHGAVSPHPLLSEPNMTEVMEIRTSSIKLLQLQVASGEFEKVAEKIIDLLLSIDNLLVDHRMSTLIEIYEQAFSKALPALSQTANERSADRIAMLFKGADEKNGSFASQQALANSKPELAEWIVEQVDLDRRAQSDMLNGVLIKIIGNSRSQKIIGSRLHVKAIQMFAKGTSQAHTLARCVSKCQMLIKPEIIAGYFSMHLLVSEMRVHLNPLHSVDHRQASLERLTDLLTKLATYCIEGKTVNGLKIDAAARFKFQKILCNLDGFNLIVQVLSLPFKTESQPDQCDTILDKHADQVKAMLNSAYALLARVVDKNEICQEAARKNIFSSTTILFRHCGTSGVNASVAIGALFANCSVNLDAVAKSDIVALILSVINRKGREARFLRLLLILCSSFGEGHSANSNIVLSTILHSASTPLCLPNSSRRNAKPLMRKRSIAAGAGAKDGCFLIPTLVNANEHLQSLQGCNEVQMQYHLEAVRLLSVLADTFQDRVSRLLPCESIINIVSSLQEALPEQKFLTGCYLNWIYSVYFQRSSLYLDSSIAPMRTDLLKMLLESARRQIITMSNVLKKSVNESKYIARQVALGLRQRFDDLVQEGPGARLADLDQFLSEARTPLTTDERAHVCSFLAHGNSLTDSMTFDMLLTLLAAKQHPINIIPSTLDTIMDTTSVADDPTLTSMAGHVFNILVPMVLQCVRHLSIDFGAVKELCDIDEAVNSFGMWAVSCNSLNWRETITQLRASTHSARVVQRIRKFKHNVASWVEYKRTQELGPHDKLATTSVTTASSVALRSFPDAASLKDLAPADGSSHRSGISHYSIEELSDFHTSLAGGVNHEGVDSLTKREASSYARWSRLIIGQRMKHLVSVQTAHQFGIGFKKFSSSVLDAIGNAEASVAESIDMQNSQFQPALPSAGVQTLATLLMESSFGLTTRHSATYEYGGASESVLSVLTLKGLGSVPYLHPDIVNSILSRICVAMTGQGFVDSEPAVLLFVLHLFACIASFASECPPAVSDAFIQPNMFANFVSGWIGFDSHTPKERNSPMPTHLEKQLEPIMTDVCVAAIQCCAHPSSADVCVAGFDLLCSMLGQGTISTHDALMVALENAPIAEVFVENLRSSMRNMSIMSRFQVGQVALQRFLKQLSFLKVLSHNSPRAQVFLRGVRRGREAASVNIIQELTLLLESFQQHCNFKGQMSIDAVSALCSMVQGPNVTNQQILGETKLFTMSNRFLHNSVDRPVHTELLLRSEFCGKLYRLMLYLLIGNTKEARQNALKMVQEVDFLNLAISSNLAFMVYRRCCAYCCKNPEDDVGRRYQKLLYDEIFNAFFVLKHLETVDTTGQIYSAMEVLKLDPHSSKKEGCIRGTDCRTPEIRWQKGAAGAEWNENFNEADKTQYKHMFHNYGIPMPVMDNAHEFLNKFTAGVEVLSSSDSVLWTVFFPLHPQIVGMFNPSLTEDGRKVLTMLRSARRDDPAKRSQETLQQQRVALIHLNHLHLLTQKPRDFWLYNHGHAIEFYVAFFTVAIQVLTIGSQWDLAAETDIPLRHTTPLGFTIIACAVCHSIFSSLVWYRYTLYNLPEAFELHKEKARLKFIADNEDTLQSEAFEEEEASDGVIVSAIDRQLEGALKKVEGFTSSLLHAGRSLDTERWDTVLADLQSVETIRTNSVSPITFLEAIADVKLRQYLRPVLRTFEFWYLFVFVCASIGGTIMLVSGNQKSGNFLFSYHLSVVLLSSFGQQLLASIRFASRNIGWVLLIQLLLVMMMSSLNYFGLYDHLTCSTLGSCMYTTIRHGMMEGSKLALYATGVQESEVKEVSIETFMSYFFLFYIGWFMPKILQAQLVDALAQMRMKERGQQADDRAKCFICTHGWTQFDNHVKGGFDEHIKSEHNPVSYLGYVFYLRFLANPKEYDLCEQYVQKKIDRNDPTWMPLNRSSSLERALDEAEDEEEEDKKEKMTDQRMNRMENALNDLVSQMGDMMAKISDLSHPAPPVP
jgi:hypothetical protein